MRVCKCGYPLVLFMAVRKKELACFKCGKLFGYCDRDIIKDTLGLELQLKQAKELKRQFFKEYSFEKMPGGIHTKSLSPKEFKKWFNDNFVYKDESKEEFE